MMSKSSRVRRAAKIAARKPKPPPDPRAFVLATVAKEAKK